MSCSDNGRLIAFSLSFLVSAAATGGLIYGGIECLGNLGGAGGDPCSSFASPVLFTASAFAAANTLVSGSCCCVETCKRCHECRRPNPQSMYSYTQMTDDA